VRGGYGIYYSEIPANTVAARDLNGPTGFFSFSAAPGFDVSKLAGYPDKLENPKTEQATLGAEHRFGGGWDLCRTATGGSSSP
jgi:hypothetical protein